MPFVQRFVEPKFLSRTQLFDDDGRPKIEDFELEAVTNNTLCNALRQLASLVLAANDIFDELGGRLEDIKKRSEALKSRIGLVEGRVERFDPKEVTVPESDIGSFALIKNHYHAEHRFDSGLFSPESRPLALRNLYESAAKTPVNIMRQLDRWRRDGNRCSRFFVCTPVLGAKRRKIRNRVDIDIETSMPAAVEELRRWTSNEALGDVTVTPDCVSRITSTLTDGNATDGTLCSDDEGIDHKLPSPEEQLQVMALKFPAEIVAVDVTGKSFDRMSTSRRSLMHKSEIQPRPVDGADDSTAKRKPRNRRTRSRRRNTLAGTDQKEIRDALTAGLESSPNSSSTAESNEATTAATTTAPVIRSKSSDLLRVKKESPDARKSHFNTIKQWGKSRYDKLINKIVTDAEKPNNEPNLYETVTMKKRRDSDKIDAAKKRHERNSSISSSEKSSISFPVKLRESSTQRRIKRLGGGSREEPHSSSGNWSASSESGRASIGSEITTHPKSTTTSSNSLNVNNQAPSSVNSIRRRFINTPTTSSEGTLTPDIIHDLDLDSSSVYSCDTEGYYTSFHVDSGLKTLKEEDTPPTPLHSSCALTNNLSAESEYELFGKGSTSTTTSSAGTICTTLRASDSSKSLLSGPAVPERKSSLSKLSSNESSLERDFSDKTGTVKRSPATLSNNNNKPIVVAVVHKDGDQSPDSGHNTSSSPIESISSPNGVRTNSDFEFSESSDMEGPERIERIREKTTINSSRIPSMCVITPQQSDDEYDDYNNKKTTVIKVNPQSGYATIENLPKYKNLSTRTPSPSPSGGTNTIKDVAKDIQQKPIIKATLLPINNVLGRIKSNIVNFKARRERSKSPTLIKPTDIDAGEYVTIADVHNNNEDVNKNLSTVLSGKIKDTEYISLNELPCNNNNNKSNSLERKKGARVILDAEGKVVYTSDSLKRNKTHSTFEPGKNVKPTDDDITHLLTERNNIKSIRPINSHKNQVLASIPQTEFNRPAASQIIIKANAGTQIIRKQPVTIVTPTSPTSPVRSPTKGAYVRMQEQQHLGNETNLTNMYRYGDVDTNRFIYATLPTRKQHFFTNEIHTERSVTPDITRGLERSSFTQTETDSERGCFAQTQTAHVPDLNRLNRSNESIRISPIDPRSHSGFKSSTPSTKVASNLDSRLLSPKKSTMSNEELYAVIHKSKKKMNIDTDKSPSVSPIICEDKRVIKSPETGYLSSKSRSRLSWSPSGGEYVDFNKDIDRSPPNNSRNKKPTSTLDFKRLLLQKSSTHSPKKLSAVEQLKLSKEQIQVKQQQKQPEMNILDLSGSPRSLVTRKLLNQASAPGSPNREQKQMKILSPKSQWRFNSPRSDVLSSPIPEDTREDDNSGERRSLGDKNDNSGGENDDKSRTSPKGMPRFNIEPKPYTSASQRLYNQRAQYFSPRSGNSKDSKDVRPTLETSF